MQTFMELVKFLLPRIGAKEVLSYLFDLLCDSTPAQRTATLRLFENDHTPTETTTKADLTEATFDGYSAVPLQTAGDCTGFLQGEALDNEGEWAIFLDQQIFTQAGALGGLVYGAYITIDDDADEVLGVVRFADAPLSLGDASGDIIKLAGRLQLRPQMT